MSRKVNIARILAISSFVLVGAQLEAQSLATDGAKKICTIDVSSTLQLIAEAGHACGLIESGEKPAQPGSVYVGSDAGDVGATALLFDLP